MAIYKLSLPSRNDLKLGYAACAFPVFVWSIYHVLNEIPGWLMRLKTWDLIGAVAYTQALALFESLIVFSILVVLATFLPVQFAKKKYSSLSASVIFTTSVWFILAHLNDEAIRLWGAKNFLAWGIIYLLSLAISLFFVYRCEIVRQAIDALLQRLSVLSYLYTSFGIVSIFIVLVRNI